MKRLCINVLDVIIPLMALAIVVFVIYSWCWAGAGIMGTTGAVPASAPAGGTLILVPDGQGVDDTWTASAGIKYQCIDDGESPSTSDYIYSGTSYQEEQYTLTDHATVTGTITNVVIYVFAQYTESAKTIRLGVNSGGTLSYDGLALPATWGVLSKEFLVDPNTGLAWTWSAIDAIGVYLRVNSLTSGLAQVANVYVAVTYE